MHAAMQINRKLVSWQSCEYSIQSTLHYIGFENINGMYYIVRWTSLSQR